MKIHFKTNKLIKICTIERECGKLYSDKIVFKKIYQRLLEFRAASHLGEISRLPPMRCHQLKHNRSGQFAVDLTGKLRLVFVPGHDHVPIGLDGEIDIKEITEITIIEICDYHDE